MLAFPRELDFMRSVMAGGTNAPENTSEGSTSSSSNRQASCINEKRSLE